MRTEGYARCHPVHLGVLRGSRREGYRGMSNYIVNTKRWDVGNTVILLADRGGQGKPLAGYIYVAYLPLAQAIPTEKKNREPNAKTPF